VTVTGEQQAAMAGRGAAETCKCHHVNRWGSHPSSMERGGRSGGMERGAAREPALLLQDACGLRGEKGDWLLSSSTLKTTMAAAYYRERHWHRPRREFTCDHHPSLSTSRERWSKESLVKFNLFTDVAFSLPLNSAEPFLSSLLWFAFGQFCFVFLFQILLSTIFLICGFRMF